MAKTKTQETVKPYAFRKLSATDVFPMFTIMSKIGINTFADSFNAKELMKGANEQDASIVGISVALNIAQKIMSNMYRCETDIYNLLSNTSNLTVEEVKKLDFATFTEMVVDFVRKEEFADFFKVVSKLFK